MTFQEFVKKFFAVWSKTPSYFTLSTNKRKFFNRVNLLKGHVGKDDDWVRWSHVVFSPEGDQTFVTRGIREKQAFCCK